MGKEYYAFISYKSEDVEWAIWVQHGLEHYHLPASYNGCEDVRKDLRPVFRDIDELSVGNLPEQIKQALKNSSNLTVIRSPHAAESPWVPALGSFCFKIQIEASTYKVSENS